MPVGGSRKNCQIICPGGGGGQFDWTFRSLATSAFFGTARLATASAAFSMGHRTNPHISSARSQSSTVYGDLEFEWQHSPSKNVFKHLHRICFLAITIKTLKKLKYRPNYKKKDSGREKSRSRAKKLLAKWKVAQKVARNLWTGLMTTNICTLHIQCKTEWTKPKIREARY